MVAGIVIRKNEYHDSVFLMRVAKTLSEKPGVLQAAALMGTEKNKRLLLEIGFHGPEIAASAPQDLILAVQAERQDVLDAIIGSIDQWLHPTTEAETHGSVRTLEEALHRQPRSNLTAISLPGEYAGREAKKALELGMHVFLFSDHVSLEEEISLKKFAREKGLIVMGPDCGTAIISGTGIGFANRVRRGPIGVIGASGTGIQEFTSLVHRSGSGISHAIGTGSRDFSDDVGGLSFLSAIEALEKDLQTRVITILSKPPGKSTLARLAPRILKCSKPVIVCFLGFKENIFRGAASCRLASTLDEAAILAVQAGDEVPPSLSGANQAFLDGLIQKELAEKNPAQKYLRGLFAGGTFCYQAQQILMDYGIEVYSNSPLEGNLPLSNSASSIKHTLVDLGADEFTSGRPHPMIDSRLRCDRIQKEAKDHGVGILLLDIILGFNSCPDPAGDLAPAITAAKREVSGRGGALSVVASICGTEDDIQDLNRQTRILEDAGALVFPSSAQAVRFSALLAKTFTEKRNGK